MQPALCIESLLRLIGHVEVTHEDVTPPEADLAISLLVRVVELRLAPWDLFTTATGQNSVFQIHRYARVLTWLRFVSARKFGPNRVEARTEMYLVSLKASGMEMV